MYDEEQQESGGFFNGDGGDGNVFVEQEHTGYFEKLGNSFGGICLGLVLFFGAFPLLWWNEGRAVDYYQAINEGKKIIIPINSTVIDPMNEGKLVYLTGLAEPTQNLTDFDFGIEVSKRTKLSRDVSMYQWYEQKTTTKKDKVGGGTTTTTEYKYTKKWHGSRINSESFRQQGYNNPPMPYVTQEFYSNVVLGAFSLPNTMISSAFPYDDSNTSPLSQTITFDSNTIPSSNTLKTQKPVEVQGDGFYFGTPQNTQIGDTTVKYRAASGGTVSLFAQQSGSTFTQYTAKSGANLFRIEMGAVDSNTMFENAAAENKTITIILRVVGTLVMISGIALMLNPLAVAADIIPCFGDCIGGAIGIVAFLTGGFLSMVVIGIAWVANRPAVLGAAVAGMAVIGYFIYAGFRRKRERSRAINDMDGVKDLKLDRD